MFIQYEVNLYVVFSYISGANMLASILYHTYLFLIYFPQIKNKIKSEFYHSKIKPGKHYKIAHFNGTKQV